MGRDGHVRDLARLLLGHATRFRHRGLQDVATRALREPGAGRVWVVRTLNASLRVRRAAHGALVLQPRYLRSRLAYRTGATAGTRRLSLLCPTRGRAAQLARFVRFLSRSAVDPTRVELLCYVDSDDAQLPAYRLAFERFERAAGTVRCRLVVGDPVGVPAAWNALAAEAGGDLLLMANDDQLYIDYGWDAMLDARVDALQRDHPDGVFCLYFDAGQYPEGSQDFPIVTRDWYDTLGYFVPTMFSQWEVETWVFDIAKRLDRLFPVPGVFVEHLHYQDYKAPFDATYQRHRMTRETSFADHAAFLRTAPTRAAEAAKLSSVIARTGAGSPWSPGGFDA
ncbi:hypothetical protein [Micromonospora lutea]|uniref:Glycosyltransferase n=1 Tax=Micromonospora lutea TaxID=419825 RepID=A0ABQ4IT03_9ACTN|nr:hypothetical protein [Micromonospora lutea]GIJ21060.1 hypothetical protein Vlu01_16840 [Micromonospora lutea]